MVLTSLQGLIIQFLDCSPVTLFVCVLLQETVYTLPVDHQPVEEAMNHFITWLSRAEEVASNYQPLKADLITLREEEIANTVRQSSNLL